MKRLRPIPFLPAVLAALFLPAPAAAQGCADGNCRPTNVVSVRVPTLMRLRLNGTTTVWASPTRAAYDAGYQPDAGPTATVRSNGPWRLQISAASETWTPARDGARVDKPAGDLTWSTTSGAGFADLTTTPVDVATGTNTDGTSLAVFYRTLFNQASDTLGTYALVVRFTLASS